jgi:hypothetical protein
VNQISIHPIALGTLAITANYAGMLEEAAAVCLEKNGHPPGVVLALLGDSTQTLWLTWRELGDEHVSSYSDLEEATEYGAYGIAMVAVRELKGKAAISRSARGGGFDWWVGDSEDSRTLPFQGKARLEVSGILRGRPGQLEARIRQKKKQTELSDSLGPAIIAIVQFSEPLAHIETK